jgi:hypothetical protein
MEMSEAKSLRRRLATLNVRYVTLEKTTAERRTIWLSPINTTSFSSTPPLRGPQGRATFERESRSGFESFVAVN